MSDRAGDDFLACDVGNSRAALAMVQGGRVAHVVHVPLEALDGLADVLAADPAAGDRLRGMAAVASSVNPAAAARLRAVLAGVTSGPMLVAREDFPIPIIAAVDRPERVGTDRLLAALAAWRETGCATVVVDVGTAITVDSVDAEGRFLGGAILPGPTLAARSLHRYTAALPEVTFEADAAEGLGRNTEAAIRAGIVFGVAGAVERLVTEQRRCLGGDAPVVATGGGLSIVRPALSMISIVRPNLVLEGLVAAYLARP